MKLHIKYKSTTSNFEVGTTNKLFLPSHISFNNSIKINRIIDKM